MCVATVADATHSADVVMILPPDQRPRHVFEERSAAGREALEELAASDEANVRAASWTWGSADRSATGREGR
ncbi:MAG: hypothetical protein ACRELZ_00510 [Candidatus Rokuibacteriota bacterium]